jgi:hypothetical protein
MRQMVIKLESALKWAQATWLDQDDGSLLVEVTYHKEPGHESVPTMSGAEQNDNRMLKLRFVQGEPAPYVFAFAAGEGPVKVILTEV